MLSHYQKFRRLHESSDLFLLPNIWNAKSAMAFQENGFPAIATSSAAVASSLGYDDGENMGFADYLSVIKRILASVNIPLSVDIETGYGTTANAICTNIQQLSDLGVVAINIEDSIIGDTGRALQDATAFADRIDFIKNKLVSKNIDIFFNIRCDTYLLACKNKQSETLHRIRLYESSGADGIFLPCICAEDDIKEAVSSTKLPINVMCIPGLPDFETLQLLGVKRVSLGGFLFDKVYNNISAISREIAERKDLSSLLS